jgi:penicillin-binding protein 1C
LSDRHGRAAAFGVNSLLNLPFPSAVKTGTSSNFRDTWTVGFTTDYTVATWVGNFNGEPMRHVSGITGAAPLWSRIMLHLHEFHPPENFPPPSGLEQLPICATTGLKPTNNCTSVVQEYIFSKDKAAYAHPDNFQLPSEYDEWLSRQQGANFSNSELKIISPHNGDLFLLYPGSQGQQQLEFKVSGTSNQPLDWKLNGEKLMTQSPHNRLFWHLKPGNWNLSVSNLKTTNQVNFHVEPANFTSNRRGFSSKE